MKTISEYITTVITILLLMSGLQMVFQGMITNSVYDFTTYVFMGWVFQILYWILSLSFSLKRF